MGGGLHTLRPCIPLIFSLRISIANADLALAHGDTDHALTLLQGITEDKPYFIQVWCTASNVLTSAIHNCGLYSNQVMHDKSFNSLAFSPVSSLSVFLLSLKVTVKRLPN